jgi:hypothetical protein
MSVYVNRDEKTLIYKKMTRKQRPGPEKEQVTLLKQRQRLRAPLNEAQ